MTVLLVEDEPRPAQLLQGGLSDQGHHVDVGSTDKKSEAEAQLMRICGVAAQPARHAEPFLTSRHPSHEVTHGVFGS